MTQTDYRNLNPSQMKNVKINKEGLCSFAGAPIMLADKVARAHPVSTLLHHLFMIQESWILSLLSGPSRRGHGISYGPNVHGRPWDHCRDWGSHTVCHTGWSSEVHRGPHHRWKGPTNGLPNFLAIDSNARSPWHCLGRWLTRLSRGPRWSGTVCLACDWRLWGWDVTIAHTRDVMDARPPPVFVHWVEADEVLLSMACHLGRCSCYNKVSRNAPPVPFSVPF